MLIGGNFQGKNPDIQNASFTTVADSAYINVDAVTSGNGGRIIVWSDQTTQFLGGLSARGGADSGNGGFAEVSGKHNLYFPQLLGHVDLSAPKGKSGELLLDPEIIDIVATGADACIDPGGNCTGSFTLGAADIQAFLTSPTGGSLLLKTNYTGGGDNINITVPLVTTNAQSHVLTFDAGDQITGFSNLTGNPGVDYSVVLKAALVGSVSKTYDGTNAATLTDANFVVRGGFDTDTITITGVTNGTYTSTHVVDNGGAGSVTSGRSPGAITRAPLMLHMYWHPVLRAT